jgi:hypothetical protein
MFTFTISSARCVTKFDSGFACNTFYGTNEVKVFHLLNECEDITLSSAAKAHVPAGLIIDTERGRTF